ERAIPVLGKPDGIRQPNQNRLLRRDEWKRTEDRIAQSARLRLYCITQVNRTGTSAKIIDDVALSRSDYEADLGGAAQHQSVDEVLSDGARAFHRSLEPTADREQFLGKGE